MLKKFIVCGFLVFMSQFLCVYAVESELKTLSSVNHSSQLKEIIATIQKLPEAKKLIETIQKEGSISIICNKDVSVCRQFGACWDPEHRIILVHMSSKSSKGELIGSILFELQNAATNSKILYYDDLVSKGQIGKESYVRAIEYLEYQNSLKASKLAEQGIRLRFFPENARLFTYSSFEEHYHVQKAAGHSAWIAHNYNQITSSRLPSRL